MLYYWEVPPVGLCFVYVHLIPLYMYKCFVKLIMIIKVCVILYYCINKYNKHVHNFLQALAVPTGDSVCVYGGKDWSLKHTLKNEYHEAVSC